MAEVFAGVDTSTLRLIAELGPKPQPLRPRRPRGRHGKVTVRYEAPESCEPVTAAERLRAAALEERNWAWGRDEQAPRERTQRKPPRYN